MFNSPGLIECRSDLCGDLNARTANVDDFVTIDHNIPELLEFTQLLDVGIDIQRSS